MSKAIYGFNKKPTINLALYKGLLLLYMSISKLKKSAIIPHMMRMLTLVALVFLLILMTSKVLAQRGRGILHQERKLKERK